MKSSIGIKSNPLVSIMIPTYNQKDYIEHAIDSALKQDYPNKEIIVSDDASSDGTGHLVKEKYGDQIQLHQHIKNIGRTENYRFLLNNLSKGEFVLNLDGDDMLLDPSLISKSMALIQGNKNVVFCQSRKYRLKSPIKINIFDNHNYELYTGKEYIYESYATFRFNHLTTLYNAEIARKIDFYRKNIIASDAESLLRLASYGNVILREERAAFWRDHGSNISSTKKWEKQFYDATDFVESTFLFLNNKYPEKTVENRNWKHKLLIQSIFPLLGRNLRRLNLGNVFQIMRAGVKVDSLLFFKPYVLKYILLKTGISKTT